MPPKKKKKAKTAPEATNPTNDARPTRAASSKGKQRAKAGSDGEDGSVDSAKQVASAKNVKTPTTKRREQWNAAQENTKTPLTKFYRSVPRVDGHFLLNSCPQLMEICRRPSGQANRSLTDLLVSEMRHNNGEEGINLRCLAELERRRCDQVRESRKLERLRLAQRQAHRCP